MDHESVRLRLRCIEEAMPVRQGVAPDEVPAAIGRVGGKVVHAQDPPCEKERAEGGQDPVLFDCADGGGQLGQGRLEDNRSTRALRFIG